MLKLPGTRSLSIGFMQSPDRDPYSRAPGVNTPQRPTHVTFILTSYNRRESTLTCLARLEASARELGLLFSGVLVDDGSSDGTGPAVKDRFPWVQVEYGDGQLFWNRGMHRAQEIASRGPTDFILWINDDTFLSENALSLLLRTHEALRLRLNSPVIVVGATVDPRTGKLSYSGQVSAGRLKPFTFRKVWSATDPIECETMNGNAVLLPIEVVRAVGNLDPVYEHAMGDMDYALRARRLGFHVFVAPGHVGTCAVNAETGTYLDSTLPASRRWRLMLGKKGLPPQSWRHFTRTHGGVFWWIYFCWPYIRFALTCWRAP